jgi:predicted lipoprotein with Yx(FWY)xxD motif
MSLPTSTKLSALLAPAAVAVVVAGCGGSGSQGGAAASAGTPMHRAAQVNTRHTSVGTVLVDAHGRTLYLFKKDEGAMSTCYGSCASLWPPLTTDGKASAGKGVVAGKLGTSKRTDGATEVTYAGHPLYTYAGDAKPGDVNGQGLDQFGAEWDALPPSGAEDDD